MYKTALSLALLVSAPAFAGTDDDTTAGLGPTSGGMDLSDAGKQTRSAPSAASRPSSAPRPSSARPSSAPRPTSARTTSAPRPTTSSRTTVTRTVTTRPVSHSVSHAPVHTSSHVHVSSRPPAAPHHHPAPPPPRTHVHSAPVHVHTAPVHPTVTYHHIHPYHGVFVYGPAPVYHHHYEVIYREAPEKEIVVEKEHLPTRSVDRANTLAVGLRTGSYFGAYDGANAFGDMGLGATVRYRPAEAVGLELALERHDQEWSSANERSHTLAQGSVELFAAPWSRVSPYVLGGVTWTGRSIEDDIFDRPSGQVLTVASDDPLYGLHAGAGVEFAIGKSLALDLEGRYVGYVSGTPEGDPTIPGAFTTTAGVLVHF